MLSLTVRSLRAGDARAWLGLAGPELEPRHSERPWAGATGSQGLGPALLLPGRGSSGRLELGSRARHGTPALLGETGPPAGLKTLIYSIVTKTYLQERLGIKNVKIILNPLFTFWCVHFEILDI